MAKNIMNIMWPLVITTTITLYVLIILTLPFNTKAATILLFALIAYWSRIPGIGIPTPFYILYRADLVDLFSILIAINVGPVQGSLFAIFGNIWSRLAGTQPYWRGVLKDTAIQSVISLIIPVVYNLLGQNIFYTVVAYTIMHRISFVILHFALPDMSNIEFFIVWTGASGGLFLVNIVYGLYFGEFLDGLLKSGVEFNWTLFALATSIIILIKINMSKKGSSKKKSFFSKCEGWAKLRIYLFLDLIKNARIRNAILRLFQKDYASEDQENKEETRRKFFVSLRKYRVCVEEYEETSLISNPEEVLLGFFENSNDENILKGKNSAFIFRVVIIFFAMIGSACVMNKYVPGFFEGLFVLFFSLFSIMIFLWVVKNLIPWFLRLV